VGSLRYNSKKLTHDCDLLRSFHSTRHLWSVPSSAAFSSECLSNLIQSYDLLWPSSSLSNECIEVWVSV
jgi:hypothetical protein